MESSLVKWRTSTLILNGFQTCLANSTIGTPQTCLANSTMGSPWRSSRFHSPTNRQSKEKKSQPLRTQPFHFLLIEPFHFLLIEPFHFSFLPEGTLSLRIPSDSMLKCFRFTVSEARKLLLMRKQLFFLPSSLVQRSAKAIINDNQVFLPRAIRKLFF